MNAELISWLLTYALHSALLLGAAWLVTHRWVQSHSVREVIWKTALIGGLVTASLQVGLGIEPIGGLVAVGRTTSDSPAAAAGALTGPAVRQSELARAKTTSPMTDAKSTGPLFNTTRLASQPVSLVSAVPSSTVAPVPSTKPQWTAAGLSLISAAWLGTAVLLLGLYGISRLRLSRRLGERRAVRDPALTVMLADLRTRAAYRGRVRLTAAAGLASPVALGWSEIALPDAALIELEPDQQRSMLAHELAHLARRDPLWLTLACLIERLFFFQPLNRYARRQVQEAAEYLCDDWAVRRTGSGLTLAKCLVKVAEWIDTTPQPVPLSAMAERRSQLVSRIHRLIENRAMLPQPRRLWLIPAAFAVLFLTALAVPGISTGISEAQQPQTPDSTVDSVQASTPRTSEFRVRELQRRLERLSRKAMASFSRAPRPPRVAIAPMPPMPAMAPVAAIAGVNWPKVSIDAQRAERQAEAAVAWGSGLDGRKRHDTTSVAVPALISALKDSDVEVRRAAAQSLSNLQDPRAVPALIEALKDSDAEVRASAAEALGNLEDARAVPALIGLLKDGNVEVRRHALGALRNMPGKPSAEPFLPALSDTDAEVRQEAIQGVAESGDKRGVQPLIKLLSDPSAEVRSAAASGLGELGDPAAAEPVAALLRDSNADVRCQAASALSRFELTQAPAGLIEATRDKNADVRQNAVSALGQIRDPKTVPALKALLADPNADVREQAVSALGEIRDAAALDALIGALKSSDPVVRREAASSLGQRDD